MVLGFLGVENSNLMSLRLFALLDRRVVYFISVFQPRVPNGVVSADRALSILSLPLMISVVLGKSPHPQNADA